MSSLGISLSANFVVNADRGLFARPGAGAGGFQASTSSIPPPLHDPSSTVTGDLPVYPFRSTIATVESYGLQGSPYQALSAVPQSADRSLTFDLRG